MDTIVAIATALSNQGIAIIKMSGADALDITMKVFKGPNLIEAPSHTIHYGYIYDGDKLLDEVLVSVFRAPRSYTRETVVEINCHGGNYVTQEILQLLLRRGARLAEPGEFTKRAFLNGRIDLTQAEAVMDVIDAQTSQSLQLANYGLSGKLKERIIKLREAIASLIIAIEVNIDYPEYEDEVQMTNEILLPALKDIIAQVNELIETSKATQIYKTGIKTALIGRPNVGKSSLLNALLREDKAIVTNIAGTTRDIVEGDINLSGIILHLIDTAGMRKTDNIIEQFGVQKTAQIINDAELLLLVFDYNQTLNDDDLKLLELTKHRKRLIIVNKVDLQKQIDLSKFDDYLLVSSFNEQDIKAIEQAIIALFDIKTIDNYDVTYLGNVRQMALLDAAFKQLCSSRDTLQAGLPIDLANLDLREAWKNLGSILGEVVSADLIEEMFARFCLGK